MLNKIIARGWLSPEQADTLAVANNLHPSAIWPEEWRAYLKEYE